VYFDNAQLLVTEAEDGSISGTVTDDSDTAISGATVETSDGQHSTTTDANGDYTLSDVPPGTYSVTASKDGYVDQTASVVVDSSAATTQDFSLTEVSGTEQLSNEDFEDGEFSFWGGDMADDWGAAWRGTFDSATWDVESLGGDHGDVVEMTSLASDFEAGIRQQVTGLTAGAAYFFSAEAYQEKTGTTAWMAVDDGTGGQDLPSNGTPFTNTASQWNSCMIAGTVPSNGTLRVHLWAYNESSGGYVYFDNASLLVETEAPGAISGYVYDEYGTPIEGATVETDSGGYDDTTDSTGAYLMSDVTAGTYTVSASATGYVGAETAGVTVSAGSTASVDFYLTDAGQTEVLLNGDMEGGYFDFWGGDIADDWGATWRGDFENADWIYENVGGLHEHAMRLSGLDSGFEAGIIQEVTGLTPGSSYTFTAEVYEDGSGTTAWIAVTDGSNDGLPEVGTAFGGDTQTWVSQYVNGTVPSGGKLRVYLWANREGTSSKVYFDNASLLID